MSDFGKLNWLDLGKSLIVAFVAACLGVIYPVIQAGTFPDWPMIQNALLVGLAGAVAYLLKNLFSGTSPAKA